MSYIRTNQNLNGLMTILKQPIAIYAIAFLFVAGGFMVVTHHHHCKDLYDVKNLHVYCQYVKNPIGKHSILSLIIFLFLFSIICFHWTEETRIICAVKADSTKKQYRVFLSAFPYRAPPNS